jgi:parallel beta-helix repeat protein
MPRFLRVGGVERTGRLAAGRIGVLALALLVAGLLPAAARASGPVVIGCDQAGARVELTADAVLDPSCTYAGFDITASHVTLDCRGARIAGPTGAGSRGIEVSTPVDVELADVTVRGCEVEGFLNSIRVTRVGFRTLARGQEFVHPVADVVLEDNDVHDSRGVGIYVDGYVSGVTIRNNRIHGAGSSGIYLETGSKESVVIGNQITGNGFRENGPGGQTFEVGGTTVWFWGPGREGISVDGSYRNRIVGNTFSGNSAGGVFLYKNCGEYPDRNPERWFERRDHADDNLIEGNDFSGGVNGVWIGSRMGENTLPMECSDPAYVDEPGRRIVLDFAARTTVRANAFHGVTYGIRVEDDHAVIEANRFDGPSPAMHAVVIGTPYRTTVLHHPVTGTVLRANASTIVANPDPYRWVHGESATVVRDNRALGRPVGICEGEPLPRGPFVMALAVAAAGPGGARPPTPDLTFPTVGALPACPDESAGPSGPSVVPTSPAAPGGAVAVEGTPAYTG